MITQLRLREQKPKIRYLYYKSSPGDLCRRDQNHLYTPRCELSMSNTVKTPQLVTGSSPALQDQTISISVDCRVSKGNRVRLRD